MTGEEFRAALAELGLRPFSPGTARILGVQRRAVARWLKTGPPVSAQTILRLLDALATQGYPPSSFDPRVKP